MMMMTSFFCTTLNQLHALIVAAETVVTADLSILNVAFDSVSLILTGFLGLLRGMVVADAMLFDIPLHEESMPQQYSWPNNLRLENISNL
jgi:hypothetical protein